MLIVDPNLPSATALARIVEPDLSPNSQEVALCADFSTARARLREYNGLNLVYLAAGAGLRTRSIVFTDDSDYGMAREVRAAGAFYEVRARLAKALPAYISASLPAHDRRDVGAFDRRRSGRAGGRRAVDQPLNLASRASSHSG
jgi:hypothetical protein